MPTDITTDSRDTANGGQSVAGLPPANDLLSRFGSRLEAETALDSINYKEANDLKLTQNEFQMLATTDGIFVEPQTVDSLKTKLTELDPKLFEKISRRSRVVKQEEEPLHQLKQHSLDELVSVQQSGGDGIKRPNELAPAAAPKRRRTTVRKTRAGKRGATAAPQYDESLPADGNSSGVTLKLNLTVKEQKAITKQYDNTYISIWKDMSRKDGPKAYRMFQQTVQAKQINLRKTGQLASRESKRWKVKTTKNIKDQQTKARRSMREMLNFWKRNEREEKAQKQRQEQATMAKARKEEEEREAKRQSRKLNFLINQTELYSHFIGNKLKTSEIEGDMGDKSLPAGAVRDGKNMDDLDLSADRKDFHELDFDSTNDADLEKTAAANAQNALLEARQRAQEFNKGAPKDDLNEGEMNFQNPTGLGDLTIEQPKMLDCTLKEYQKKGLNWLASLYEQGINGILADEMGLGKTVQSISVLAYLAETHNIWGPFLVVTPASTLHNWQQEITRFVPDFKVLPYWGSAKDRKILRKFWDRKSVVYSKDSPFHVVVTSYQLVVADAQYFQKMRWQYMILDEAQAIKSSQSTRWKSLLSFQCRNRLLLTGTPIQNNMQELWALLHFIMPSLFDSHDEFSEWFSKDIESHAKAHTELNRLQLNRLHAILKPFMLRRIKKNVQSELGEKIEIDVFCNLTNRQKKQYKMLRSQVNLVDLIENSKKIHTSNSSDDETSDSLMNVVMQFRKVCNHPDLFERADTRSAFSCGRFAETGSLVREANEDLLELDYTARNTIEFTIPKLVFDEIIAPFDDELARKRLLPRRLTVWSPENIARSETLGCLRVIDATPNKVAQLATQNALEVAISLRNYRGDGAKDAIDRLRKYGGARKPSVVLSDEPYIKELATVARDSYYSMYLANQPQCAFETARAPPIELTCSRQRFNLRKSQMLFDREIRQALFPLNLDSQWDLYKHDVPMEAWPKAEMLPEKLSNQATYSTIRLPSMDRFVLDSGKLKKLDEMLPQLKKGDHKCLMYFQMTKMMDLMEEYLTYRQYKYIRLDGSSRLSDRRDLVHDWQTRPELFIFLLSTRAGGLGINLTAADTVIFYDSDWNPTIDSQAMDRAHRLGQTRQVTVYRLLARGTIEERMRDRAKQKEQVQAVVMGGKVEELEEKDDAKEDKKEMARWLLEDNED